MMLQTSTLAPMIVATTLMCALVAGQIPPQYAVNITVFHVNPEEYGVAPINMNTADALGDMYFDLRTKGLPIEVGDCNIMQYCTIVAAARPSTSAFCYLFCLTPLHM
jgi:hypothetical protein